MSYAYRNEDGRWLVYHERTTHTGTHHDIGWVDSIHEASVLSCLPLEIRRIRSGLKDSLERIEVTVTRRVHIVDPEQHPKRKIPARSGRPPATGRFNTRAELVERVLFSYGTTNLSMRAIGNNCKISPMTVIKIVKNKA